MVNDGGMVNDGEVNSCVMCGRVGTSIVYCSSSSCSSSRDEFLFYFILFKASKLGNSRTIINNRLSIAHAATLLISAERALQKQSS